MAYGTFISEYEKTKSEIENTLFEIEHNFTTVIETGSLGLEAIIHDLENMTDDDFEELYAYDDLNSIRNQYEQLMKDFRLLLDRFLVCAYHIKKENGILFMTVAMHTKAKRDPHLIC